MSGREPGTSVLGTEKARTFMNEREPGTPVPLSDRDGSGLELPVSGRGISPQ